MQKNQTKNDKEQFTKNDFLYITIIVFLSLILRLYRLNEQSVWLDEYVVIGNAKYCNIVDYLKLLYINVPDYGISPASAFILYYWINLFPEIDWLWRILPITFGVLTIVTTYFLGKELVGRRISFFACLLFSFSPFNIWFHQELKCYAFIQFFVILSYLGLWMYFNHEKENWQWCFFSFFSNLILPWFHAIYILTPLFQIPVLIFSFPKALLRKKMLWSALSVLSIVPWIVWYIKMSPFLFNIMDSGGGGTEIGLLFDRLFGFDSVGISEELIPAWKTNILDIDNPILSILVRKIFVLDYFIYGLFVITTIIFISSILWKIKQNKDIKNTREVFITLSLFVPVISLLSIVVITHKPVFHPLYNYYTLPFIYILSSSVIFKFNPKILSYFLAILLVTVYIGQCISFISFKNRTDYKNATIFIEENAGLNDIILGQRMSTFWDINKIYIKRNDLKYQSFFTLFGVMEEIKEKLNENERNRIWIVIEPITLYIIYNYDPIAKLTECLNNNGLDVYWKVYPGQYNLYIGQVAKNFRNMRKNTCDILINTNKINYEKLLTEMNIISKDEKEKKENLYILQKYIAIWPIFPFSNIFTISELIKDGHYYIADKLCDYLLDKYPQFGDIYLLKFIICYINERDSDCEYYLNTAYKQKKALKKIIYPILKNGNEVYNYYKKLNKFCLFPLGDSLVTFMNK